MVTYIHTEIMTRKRHTYTKLEKTIWGNLQQKMYEKRFDKIQTEKEDNI